MNPRHAPSCGSGVLVVFALAFSAGCTPATPTHPPDQGRAGPATIDAASPPAHAVPKEGDTTSAAAPATDADTAAVAPTASTQVEKAAEPEPEDLVLEYGPFARKLEEKEKEKIQELVSRMNRQPRFTLLTQSTTKQNADGWIRLLRAQMVAVGFDEKRLTTRACVGPSTVVLSAIVSGDRDCTGVDAFQKNKK